MDLVANPGQCGRSHYVAQEVYLRAMEEELEARCQDVDPPR